MTLWWVLFGIAIFCSLTAAFSVLLVCWQDRREQRAKGLKLHDRSIR